MLFLQFKLQVYDSRNALDDQDWMGESKLFNKVQEQANNSNSHNIGTLVQSRDEGRHRCTTSFHADSYLLG